MLLNAGAYLPMLPNVAGTLGVAFPYAVWGQGDYFTAMGAAFLIARPLMMRYGPKKIAILSYVLFSLASLLAWLTTAHFFVYTGMRMLQGTAAGLSFTPSFFLLLEYYRGDRQKTAATLWSLAAFVPFSIGPALGGWLAYTMGDWRLLLVVSGFIALFVAAMLWGLLADWEDAADISVPIRKQMVLYGLFLSSAWSLQQVLNVGVLSDLSSRFSELVPLVLVCVLFTGVFWQLQYKKSYALIKPHVFKYPNYLFTLSLLCIAFIAIQGSVVQFIIRFQLVEGYTPWHVGLLFLPIFVLSKPVSWFTQKLIQNQVDPRFLASVSLLGMAVGFGWIASYDRPASWSTLLWPQFLLGAALGPFFSSFTAIALSHVPKDEQFHAIDVLNTSRNIAAGLAILLSDIAWDRLFDLELNRLSTPDADNAWRFTAAWPTATPALHDELTLHASLLTFNDIFYALSVGLLLIAGLVWLAQRPAYLPQRDLPLFESMGEEP